MIKTENNLLTMDGYFAEFYMICGENADNKYYEIWMKLEERMNERYGINKYDSYESFRQAKSRYQKGR